MRIRSWSVRNKIVALLLVPLVSLVVLWAVAVNETVGTALDLTAARTYHDHARLPGEELVSQLQRERRLSVVYLGAGRTEPESLADQRARTDGALARLRRQTSTEDFTDAAGPLVRQRLRELLDALDTLGAAREIIDRGELDRAGAVRLYSGMIDAAHRLFVPLVDLGDRLLARNGRAVVALGHAREEFAREDALVAGAVAAGRLASADPGQLVQAIAMRRALYDDAVAELPAVDQIAYRTLTKGEQVVRLVAMEDRLVAESRAGAAAPVDIAQWNAAQAAVADQLRDLESGAGKAVIERRQQVADRMFARLWLIGLLALAAVLLSVGIAWWLDRSLVGGLSQLRTAALDLARTRLPDVIGRLRRGEDVDVDVASPLPYGDDELGRLRDAFNEVQRRTVESAMAEARRSEGINEVFLSIAERSQHLLHRQLALLDDLERKVTEPKDLADLFRLDHLATQLRRHTEDLVILAGAVPGRGWRRPVPMVDVIRGAVSEVDGYARVTTEVGADVALVGRAVADTIHLLAELIDNATSSSPPPAGVRVSGDLVPNGFAIEVEDRGDGMGTAAIALANRQLAAPPDFDPATDDRLGLFVVAQLAKPHGIGVHLRTSPYGGITAVVLIPPELVAVAPDEPTASSTSPVPLTPAGPAERPPTAGPATAEPGPRALTSLPRRPATHAAAGQVPARRVPDTANPSAANPSAAGPESGRSQTGPRLEPPFDQPVSSGTGRLPRRTRQASLASQLRESSPPAAARGPSEVDPAHTGSPTRSTRRCRRSRKVCAAVARSRSPHRTATVRYSRPHTGRIWLDSDAGRVVRPYAMTRGRVQPVDRQFDIMAFVLAATADPPSMPLEPEHRAILSFARQPVAVAEIASRLDLPLGVVRVLLGDLLQHDLITVREPSGSEQHDEDVLRTLVDRLRTL